MSATIIVVSTFLALFVGQFLLWTLFLWIGARWGKIESATFGRAFLVALATWIAQLVYMVTAAMVASTLEGWTLPIAAVLLVLTVITPWALTALIFKTEVLRALRAWMVTWVASIAGLAAVYFVVRPYLLDAFRTPTNSMAPTLLGRHCTAVCPVCGKPAYYSPREKWERHDREEHLAICEAFHVAKIRGANPEAPVQDRFLVCKFLTPRRWDLVVFRYPENPDVLHVQRLVGMPGEAVTIKYGCVWIDGRKEPPPESLRGITYASEAPDLPVKLWGAGDRVARLGDDEFFVLGDFSLRAKDSRLWTDGAPGHAPYAVPASYVRGVVTHIYWPPRRCRILR